MVDAYPLCWPEGWKRLSDNVYRDPGRFKTSFARARDGILHELKLMGAQHPVISSNIPIRRDGLPYATYKKPDDPGVAVYFYWSGKEQVIACDLWKDIESNMQAIRRTIEALRGIARWGTSEILDRAFTGFQALPAERKDWWQILEVTQGASPEECKVARNRLAKIYHPDAGSSPDVAQMAKINAAYEHCCSERGAR